MNILEIESAILSDLLQEFKDQVGNDIPCSNILENVETNYFIRSIESNRKFKGCCESRYTEDYTWDLVLFWEEPDNLDDEGNYYKCSIKYSYDGGTCAVCDPVIKAIGYTYEISQNYNDIKDYYYMDNEINTLKFFTFAKVEFDDLTEQEKAACT